MTKSDLLAATDWNSMQVSVMGFYLGMTLHDAQATAQTQACHLAAQGTPGLEKACMGKGRCYVLESTGGFAGVFLTFGSDNEISQVSVEKVFQGGGSPDVEKNQISRRFTGVTFSFFNRYSKALRLRLFGVAAKTQKNDTDGRTTFFYPHIGVRLMIDACASKGLEDRCSDLTMTFVPPV